MDSCIDGIINNKTVDGIKVEFLLPVIQVRSQELAQKSCTPCGDGDTAVAEGARVSDPAQLCPHSQKCPSQGCRNPHSTWF